MKSWRSPQVLLFVVATIIAPCGFWLADKLIPDKDVAKGWSDALDIAGEVAPWVIVAALAAVVAYLFLRVPALVAAVDAAVTGQRQADEKMSQLEATLKEARREVPTPATTDKPPERPRQQWAFASKGGTLRLAVPNSELDVWYQRAAGPLNERGLDVGLCWFHVFVDPYDSQPNRVDVTFTLYSDRSRREYQFWLADDARFTEDHQGTRSLKTERPVFEQPPWREQPNWCDIFNAAMEIAGPLIPDRETSAAIFASPWRKLSWSVSVKDYGAGRELEFEGSSAADIVQGRRPPALPPITPAPRL